MASKKNKFIAGLLALFLGAFGAHWFYLRRNTRGAIYCGITITNIIIVVIFFSSIFFSKGNPGNGAKTFSILLYFVSSAVCGVFSIVILIDAIKLFIMNKIKFNETFNENKLYEENEW